MKKEQVTFPCGKLRLEGLFFSAGTRGTWPAVVVCHPHPMYGGSMHNNVTYAIAESLLEVHINAFLFNFRGVGASEGSYGGGRVERQDVAAALDWLQEKPEADHHNLGLAGYSFGAGVAFPVACADERVKCSALISPYFEEMPDDLLKNCLKPGLILGGSADQVVPPDIVQRYGQTAGSIDHVIIIGADHFWNGYEDEMSRAVAGFFSDVFRKNQGI
ncbi:MAG: dienelactone hydrolase family protein [Dehalococcoidia bacterium]|nr:dienelactone hydrolase family protein [Dehalococcoidia bacterium]